MNLPSRILFCLLMCLLLVNSAWAQAEANEESSIVQLPVAGTVEALKQQALYLPVDQASDDMQALFRAEGFQAWTADLEESAPPLWLRLHLASPTSARNDWLRSRFRLAYYHRL